MKKRVLIIGSVMLAGVFILLSLNKGSADVPPRLIKLVITGAEGQHFTGTYVSDGITNTLSAVVPATVRLLARQVTYEFQPGEGQEGFRVELHVDDVSRTSFVSHKGGSVRGGWRCRDGIESVW